MTVRSIKEDILKMEELSKYNELIKQKDIEVLKIIESKNLKLYYDQIFSELYEKFQIQKLEEQSQQVNEAYDILNI